VKATLAGLGAREALAPGSAGKVIASFAKAVYVSLPGGILVLVAPDVHPGPLYLVLDGSPPEVPAGAAVRAEAGHLRTGAAHVSLGGCSVWAGSLPSPSDLARGAGLLAEVTGKLAARSALHADPFRDRAARAHAWLETGDLTEAAAHLAGLGPGLTPAGDDALAGLLFVRRILEGEQAESGLLPAAAAARTTEIAAAFLSWAARGQALSPGHDLVGAAARGDRKACEAACASLARIGETSGADFVLGLTWALAAAV
jgi:hypothetical protein